MRHALKSKTVSARLASFSIALRHVGAKIVAYHHAALSSLVRRFRPAKTGCQKIVKATLLEGIIFA
jgi:hypothetical protein